MQQDHPGIHEKENTSWAVLSVRLLSIAAIQAEWGCSTSQQQSGTVTNNELEEENVADESRIFFKLSHVPFQQIRSSVQKKRQSVVKTRLGLPDWADW